LDGLALPHDFSLGKNGCDRKRANKRMAKTGLSAAFQLRYDRNEVYADETES